VFLLPALVAGAESPGAGGLTAAPRLAVARGLGSAEIRTLAEALGSDDAERRRAAHAALSGLHVESLPGIAERLKNLAGHRPAPEQARDALTAFRHAVGSLRADDDVDIAPGVLPVLAETREPHVLAMAESLLLLRSLERMGTRESGAMIGDVFALDDGVWGREANRVLSRGGIDLLPALIQLRSHDDASVRRWAQWAVKQLGMDDPKKATQLEDRHLASEVVRAYGEPLDFPAMPVVVRLVDDPSTQVRQAARHVVRRFGKNAIWQLRELYQELASEPANKRWGWEQTASQLYAVIDGPDRKAARALMERGMAAFVGGQLDTMREHYDALLARYPSFPERAKLAAGYAALADRHLQDDELDAARDAYQRALRLSPAAPEAEQWLAQLSFVTAERSLTSGVADVHGYEQALSHDPEHAAARDVRDRLTGEHAERKRTRRKLAAGGAIALLVVFLVLLVRGRREPAEAEA
jgi:tetratricopeptide (TPR) repeat protein